MIMSSPRSEFAPGRKHRSLGFNTDGASPHPVGLILILRIVSTIEKFDSSRLKLKLNFRRDEFACAML